MQERLPQSYSIVLLGKPGAGKTTLSGWLARKLGASCVDMGTLLRQRVSTSDASNQMAQGALISSELCRDILAAELLRLRPACTFVITGFPRTVDQLPLLDQLLRELRIAKAVFLVLDVPDSVAQARAQNRRDKAIKEGRLRADDELSVLKRRLEEYYAKTAPLVEQLLHEQHRAVVTVDGARLKKPIVLQAVLAELER